MTTACFTGHRKISDEYYNKANPSAEWHTLRQFMDQIIKGMIGSPNNVDHFISGLAIGVDMLAAESVAYVRSFGGPAIRLTGAIPFPSQPSKWPEPTRVQWANICELCNEVVSVSADPYSPQKMQIRNEWMVDESDYVIAVWNGVKSGGTWNCMSYALSKNKPILTIQLSGLQWQCGWILPN